MVLKTFLSKHWLKLLIVLPIAPTFIFITSLDRFTGVSSSWRFLVSAAIVLFYLLLIFIGTYFGLRKMNIGKIIVGILTVILFFGTAYGAVQANRAFVILENFTAPLPVERGYSLVVMADFEADELNGYGRIGIITHVEVAKEEARTEFLEQQQFIPNPITENFDIPTAMIAALYAGEIDAMIIGSNFALLYEEIEGFENIADETVVLDTFNVIIEQEEQPVTYMNPQEPFSLLILGLDSHRDEELDEGLIDTFMVATFNFDDLSFTLVSIPRDSFVPVSCSGDQYDKLAHTNHNGGISCALQTVENLMDMEINYYLMVNMTAVVDIVDAMDGITVDVPITTWEQDSRRRFGEEHRVYLEKGEHVLDGEQALALIRHRRTLFGHDFQRAEHTQLVLKAMMLEMMGSLSSVNDALNLLEVISQNMRTNMSQHEITTLAQYLIRFLPSNGVNLMDEFHFLSMGITGESEYVFFPLEMSVIHPSLDQVEAARRLMRINLGLEEPNFTFSFSFDANEEQVWYQIDDPWIYPIYPLDPTQIPVDLWQPDLYVPTEEALYVPVEPDIFTEAVEQGLASDYE